MGNSYVAEQTIGGHGRVQAFTQHPPASCLPVLPRGAKLPAPLIFVADF